MEHLKILFPDTSNVAYMEGIEFKQGEILKRKKPVIVPEYPWEETHTYLYGSVIKKGPLYRMWYQSYVDGLGFFVNYARSMDGLTWKKPLMKRYCFKGPELYPTVALDGEIKNFYLKKAEKDSCMTNIVSSYHIPSVIYDPDDKDTRYKMFGYTDAGYCTAFSRDGMNFREYEYNPVLPVMRFPNSQTNKTWFSDVAPAFKDTLTNRFIAFVKTYTIDSEGRTRRCVGISESDDFRKWSKPETIWSPGAEEDRLATAKGFKLADFYGLCGFNYGKTYLGFLWLFYIEYEIRKGTHEGKIEVYLAHSSDGKKWKRFSDIPLIPLSAHGWDTDIICTANAPVFDNDRTLIYYSGANFGHGIGHDETGILEQGKHSVKIGVASMRKDGFVYASSSQGGHFITKPFLFEKGMMNINADSRHGAISVEIMKKGRDGQKFEIRNIDSLNYKIKTKLRGPSTKIKIAMKNARLYSLEAL